MSLSPITDVAIPVASILVPTAVAILLARGERRRSINERAEERLQVQIDAREERRRAALDSVFDSLLDSVISDQELDSDAAVMKVRRLGSAIGRLQLALDRTEPWLVDWLSAERDALGVTQIYAKLGLGRPDGMSEADRARLLGSYVARANAVSQRILDYESAARSEALARKWRAEAKDCVADPRSAAR